MRPFRRKLVLSTAAAGMFSKSGEIFKLKKLKKIFLHVGADKTGSTAIQSTFHQNRSLMTELGYLYGPQLDHELMAVYFSAAAAKIDFSDSNAENDELEKRKNDALQFISELEFEIKNNSTQNLVLSYEGFLNMAENALHKLKKFLDIYSDDIEVIYYIRPPQSYARSAISQRIKSGNPSWEIHPPVNFYRPRLVMLADVFGKENIKVKKYDRLELRGGDVVIDFLHEIGLSAEAAGKLQKSGLDVNAALSEEAILIGDEIVRLVKAKGLHGIAFKELFVPILEKIQGRAYVLSQLQQTVIERAAKDDIQYIHAEFGLDINDVVKLVEHDPERISNEFAHSIARIIISHVLPEFDLSDVGTVHYDDECVIQHAPGKIISEDHGRPLMWSAGKCESLRVQVYNGSRFRWGGRIAPVRLSYHWYSSRKKSVVFDGERTELPSEGLGPDASVNVDMHILAPKLPGNYLLEITLVQEYFNWFEKIGFKTHLIDVCVK